jgi:hypothetical protein
MGISKTLRPFWKRELAIPMYGVYKKADVVFFVDFVISVFGALHCMGFHKTPQKHLLQKSHKTHVPTSFFLAPSSFCSLFSSAPAPLDFCAMEHTERAPARWLQRVPRTHRRVSQCILESGARKSCGGRVGARRYPGRIDTKWTHYGVQLRFVGRFAV